MELVVKRQTFSISSPLSDPTLPSGVPSSPSQVSSPPSFTDPSPIPSGSSQPSPIGFASSDAMSFSVSFPSKTVPPPFIPSSALSSSSFASSVSPSDSAPLLSSGSSQSSPSESSNASQTVTTSRSSQPPPIVSPSTLTTTSASVPVSESVSVSDTDMTRTLAQIVVSTSTSEESTSTPLPTASTSNPENLITIYSSTTITTMVDGTPTTITSSSPVATSLASDDSGAPGKDISTIAGVTSGILVLLLFFLVVLFLYKRAKKERITILQLLRLRDREGKAAGSVGLLDAEFDDPPTRGFQHYLPSHVLLSGQVPQHPLGPMIPQTQSGDGSGITPMSQRGNVPLVAHTSLGISRSDSPPRRRHTKDDSAASTTPLLQDLYSQDIADGPNQEEIDSHFRRASSPRAGSPSPSLFRARASDTGSLFHEEGLRDERAGFSDPLISGPNSSSSVDLGRIVDQVMGNPSSLMASNVLSSSAHRSSPLRQVSGHSDDNPTGSHIGTNPKNPFVSPNDTPSVAGGTDSGVSTPRRLTYGSVDSSSYSFIDPASEFVPQTQLAARNASVGAASSLSYASNSLYHDPFRPDPPNTRLSLVKDGNSIVDEPPHSAFSKSVYYSLKKRVPGVGGYIASEPDDFGSSMTHPQGLPKGAAKPSPPPMQTHWWPPETGRPPWSESPSPERGSPTEGTFLAADVYRNSIGGTSGHGRIPTGSTTTSAISLPQSPSPVAPRGGTGKDSKVAELPNLHAIPPSHEKRLSSSHKKTGSWLERSLGRS